MNSKQKQIYLLIYTIIFISMISSIHLPDYLQHDYTT